MKLISEYSSIDGTVTAKVYKLDEEYLVVCMDDMGVNYRTSYFNLELAENFAEDWTLK